MKKFLLNFFSFRFSKSRTYSILEANQKMLDNIFRVNQNITHILSLLEPHLENEEAVTEYRRLSAFQEVMIEFAGFLYSDEGNVFEESVLKKSLDWIDKKIAQAELFVDEATLEGYRTLQRDLSKNLSI